MAVSQEKIEQVAHTLWARVYEAEFRGKARGRFRLSREQLKQALGVKRLHASTVSRLQDAALSRGLAIGDQDHFFSFIETSVVEKYRQPPSALFDEFFPPAEAEEAEEQTDDDE